jgi:hypothetical protein
MKKRIKIFHIIFPIVLSAFILPSCKKGFLDQVPDDRLTIEQVFQRRKLSEEFLANIYSYIKDESLQFKEDHNPWMGTSDEADVTYARATHPTYYMNIGAWDQSSGYYNFWGHYYKGIRAATEFIQNIPGNEEILRLSNGQELIDKYAAEARALRAFYYFCLIRQFGPAVILPGDEVIPPDLSFEEMQHPRNSYDECVDYILEELDKSAAVLPQWYTSPTGESLDQEYGRMTKSFIMALKSRVLLYAASPFYNGNTDLSGFKNKDGKQLINQQYSVKKWADAAKAAKDVIDLNKFSLYKENTNGVLNPFLSYQNLFLTPWNSEVIYGRPANDLKTWELQLTPRFANGYSSTGATQQLVDAYAMANGEEPIMGYNTNGSPIINQASGYTETGFSTTAGTYTTTGTFNMWVNREPRFYVSIAYNGSQWINKTAEGIKIIQLYDSGNTGRKGGGDNYSRTGYLIRKNIHPSGNPKAGTFAKRPMIYFRLGEIYLNYAEALNESDPSNPDILTYLNLIRERAGIAGIPAGLNQDQMREKIRHERKIELAFEALRWFDTQRWKIAEQTNAGKYYGMNIEAGTSVNDPEFHKRTVFETRVFMKKHYWFPIAQYEMDRGKLLVQNPGWER